MIITAVSPQPMLGVRSTAWTKTSEPVSVLHVSRVEIFLVLMNKRYLYRTHQLTYFTPHYARKSVELTDVVSVTTCCSN